MKNITALTLTVFLPLALAVTGCNSDNKLEGMPDLIRNASITVTQNQEPLPDAQVILSSADGSVTWTVGGTTDASGVAKLVTHGQYPGAPAGKFKVTVTKQERPVSKIDPTGKSPEEFAAEQARAGEDLTAYDLVDRQFASASTTPALVELSAASPSATVDVGKSVRIKISEH